MLSQGKHPSEEIMSKPVKPSRQNRTITIDFNDEPTYHRLCNDGHRFIDFVAAFILSIGFQLKHKCDGPGQRLTRHSHYVRARLSGLTIWRRKCTGCRAVFTVLPHFVLRYRQMKPEIAKWRAGTSMDRTQEGGMACLICGCQYSLFDH